MTRAPLTDDELRVLSIVQRQCRWDDPVATGDVRDRAGHRVDRTLARLRDKGYITKPSKGYWLPMSGDLRGVS
jgi:chromosome segregation and condensation protein ScpB